MKKVFVDTLHCLNPEDSSDSIYMIVFRGNTSAPFDCNLIVKGPGNFWTDIDEDADNAFRKKDIPVAKYREDAVYVTWIVEQDSGRDVDGDELALWQTWANLSWKATMLTQALANLPTNQEAQMSAAAKVIITAFKGSASATIRAPFDPDDTIGEPKRLVISPKEKPVLEFKNKNGGHYKIAFMVK